MQIRFNPEDNIEDAEVKIYDITGKEVLSFDRIKHRNQNLNLSSLEHGAYILTVVTPDGQESIKFVKE